VFESPCEAYQFGAGLLIFTEPGCLMEKIRIFRTRAKLSNLSGVGVVYAHTQTHGQREIRKEFLAFGGAENV
jgi:hypothetical protein